MNLSEEILNEPIENFLKRVSSEHNLETKFVLTNAINVFQTLQRRWSPGPITVSDILTGNWGWMTDSRGKLMLKNYGWKTHDFVKQCFIFGGIGKEHWGHFLNIVKGGIPVIPDNVQAKLEQMITKLQKCHKNDSVQISYTGNGFWTYEVNTTAHKPVKWGELEEVIEEHCRRF